jgi:arsenate reductase (thioredoxin)
LFIIVLLSVIKMYTGLRKYCDSLVPEFSQIPPDRKKLLAEIGRYITHRLKQDKTASLVYICTHNSRRSQFGQVWASAAGSYFKVQGVHAYSGGTEVTSFNGNAIKALMRAGFGVKEQGSAPNPHYLIRYDGDAIPIECFSKKFQDPANPDEKFAAIMTCGEADSGCPFVPGADARFACTYEDPKIHDGKPQQDAAYDERCRQIARETLYLFSLVGHDHE